MVVLLTFSKYILVNSLGKNFSKEPSKQAINKQSTYQSKNTYEKNHICRVAYAFSNYKTGAKEKKILITSTKTNLTILII